MRFDGATWGHYLGELCIIGASADPEGRVWLLAADGHVKPGQVLGSEDFRFGPVHTYVITPEAVVATD